MCLSCGKEDLIVEARRRIHSDHCQLHSKKLSASANRHCSDTDAYGNGIEMAGRFLIVSIREVVVTLPDSRFEESPLQMNWVQLTRIV